MNNRETNETMHSNSTRANFVKRIPCFMRKYLRKKTKGKTYKKIKKKKKKKKKNNKNNKNKKQEPNFKLIKFWWDSISGRGFGNQTLYPLNHHRQHAFYSVFTIYIINDLVL